MLPDTRDALVAKLLSKIACEIVDQPEFVSINTLVADGGATFTIQSHPDDTGKLIGKQGRNAQSIRIIFSAIGMKLHRRYVIDVDGEPVETGR